MRERGARGASWSLGLATLAFTLCFAAWSLISPFAKGFKKELGLNYTQALLLTAVPVVLGSLARIPVGTLTDKYGGRKMFTLLLVFSAIPAVLFGYAHTYAQLIGVGFLLGMAGSSFAVGVPFVANWFKGSPRLGTAVGIYGMGNVGTAVAFFAAPAISNHWGRPTVGWVTAAALLAGAALVALTGRDAPVERKVTRYGEVLRSGWKLYRLAFFYFITFGGFVAMFLLLPTVLQDWFDFSKGEASARAAGFVIAATIARPTGGWLADKIGASMVLVYSFAGVAVGSAVLATAAAHPEIVPITVACLSLGAFLGAGSGAVFKLVPQEFPENAGAATGIVGAAGGLGGFFPPVFVGQIKDHTGSYTYGFVGLLAFTVVSLLLAVTLMHTTARREPGVALHA